MRDSFDFSSNISTESAAGGKMLNPYFILICIIPQMNVFISGMQAEAYGSLEMIFYSDWEDNGGLVWAGIPYSIQNCIRAKARCTV